MLWLFPWPESIKQRLCRYLLEHYLGQYFEQKIVLQQLNIDLYNGVVTLNNINLNCNALNEQLKQLNIPFEIINGSVGSIFVSVPWHDLINDNCKLEVKNINLTIRPTNDDDFLSNCNSPTTSDMFSSVFLNSMQTSRQIAENCLKDECGGGGNDSTDSNSNTIDLDENFSTTNLTGLDALTRTIDSVLARIKINADNIHIRLENLNERNSNGYSNGIALEFHIKSIKYFDIDTLNINKNNNNNNNNKATSSAAGDKNQQMNENINLPSITNKKFAIDGLTVYCDEFTVKEDSIFHHEDTPSPPSTSSFSHQHQQQQSLATSNLMTTSIYVNEDDVNLDNLRIDGQTNVNYVYTNPILCATFSGIQEIDITIKQPSISALQQPSTQQQPQQNTPKLEVNAQFGSIKCFLCPKQIHLLYELVCAFSNSNSNSSNNNGASSNDIDYLASNINLNDDNNIYGAHKQKPIRGCDQQKFESLIQNDLLNQCNGAINKHDLGNLNYISLDDANGCDITLDGDEDDDDDDTEFQSFDESRSRQSKTNNNNNNLSEAQSDIYYSMLPPADNEINLKSMIFDVNRRKLSINEENDSSFGSGSGGGGGRESSSSRLNSESCDDCDDEDDKDEAEFKALNSKKDKISEQIKHASSNQTKFELFVYKIKFTMFSLTILQENPANSNNKMLGDYMKNESESYFEHVASINTSGVLNNKDFLDIRKQFFEACACNDHLLLLCKPINIQFTQKLDKSYLTITDLTCSIGHMELIEYLTNTSTKVNLSPNVASTSTSKNFKTNLIKSAIINEIIKFDATSTPTTPHEACLKLKLLLYEPTVNLLNINSSDKRRIFPKVPFKQINVNLNRLILDIDISIIDRLYHLLNPLLNNNVSDNNNTTGYNQESHQPRASAFLDEDDEYYAMKRVKLNTISNFLNSIDIKVPNLKVILRFPIAQIITSNTNLSTVDWRKRSIREQYLLLQLSEFNFQLNFYLNDFNKILLFSCNQINAFYSSLKLTDKPIQFIQANADEGSSIKLFIKLNDIKNPNYIQNIEKAMSESLMADENDLNYDSLMSKFSIKIGKNTSAGGLGGDSYSPFSSANSHISGKDNHRIINPANKYEMNKFITHTKLNSEVVINLKLPKINLLICDFDFLNDLYNCFLNDLLMWEPLAPKVLNNLIHINTTSYYTTSNVREDKFELCKSAILKTDYENDDDDDDANTPTLMFMNDNNNINNSENNSLKATNYQPHKLCFVLNAKSAKLKVYFNSILELEQKKPQINCGEFDLNLNNFKLCVLSGHYGNINNQYVSLLTDKISLAHDNRLIEFNTRKQFLYPTTQTSFEVLFNSAMKQKELIGSNKVATCLFDPQTTTNGEIKLNNYRKIKFKIPMVSLALESKLEPNSNATEPAKKHIKLALNINNACLNHLFCTDDKFWLLQLIELLNLEDIPINGYIVPIVVTELHLNVTNSSIDYRPLKLDTKALIAFKSLRISSNVAQNSQATLLIFNVEDIYLFLTNYKKDHYDLRRDYVCIANADIFEFRLLINDKPNSNNNQQQQVNRKQLKNPILDIKIRCNLIQIRTCVDSCFCLFELLSYIGTDGDIIAQMPVTAAAAAADLNNSIDPASSTTAAGATLLPVIEEQLQNVSLSSTNSSASTSEPLSIPAPQLNINKNESHICDMVEEAMSQSVYGALDHENDARYDNDSPFSNSRRNSDDYGSPFGNTQRNTNKTTRDIDSDNEADDKSLIDDFEFIDMIPGLGVLPQNGEEFVIKNLRKTESTTILIDDNYFSKPITKIDVLKAPDTYPCPIYSYSVQEISVHWSFYGGHDMYHEPNEEESRLPPSPAPVNLSTTPKKSQSTEVIEINSIKKTINFSSSTSTVHRHLSQQVLINNFKTSRWSYKHKI